MTKRKQTKNKMNKTYEIITNDIIFASLKSQKAGKKRVELKKYSKK